MFGGHSPFHRYSRNSYFSSLNKQNYHLHLLHCTKDPQYPCSLTAKLSRCHGPVSSLWLRNPSGVMHQSRSSGAVTITCDLLKGSAFLGAIQSPVQFRAEELWQRTSPLEGLPKQVWAVLSLSGVGPPGNHCHSPCSSLRFSSTWCAVWQCDLGSWFISKNLFYPAYIWEIMVLLEKELYYLLLCWRLVLCWFRLAS